MRRFARSAVPRGAPRVRAKVARAPPSGFDAHMKRRASQSPARPGLRIRVVFGSDGMLGPGKAELLARIRETGSIAAAGRAMGMSYKRAWLLVETLNATFAGPLVESSRGGAGHGGAALTETGAEVLAIYRRLQEKAEAATEPETGALRSLLSDMSDAT